MKNDRDRMKCIISETIIALCNSGLDFSSELSVEGLLGITLDGRDIMLVNIKEVIKSGVTGTKKSSSRTIASDNDSIFSESGVTGAKNSPSRNIDNDSIFSEVTSSDPTAMTVKTLGGTLGSVTVSRNGEQNSTSCASSKMTTRNQTDCFDVPVDSLTLVKSEPVENMEDNVVDSSKQGAVSWNEHCIRESVQQVVSDIDSSYMFSGRAAEDQYCEMNITNTSEQFCELSELTPDRVSSLPIAHQQNSEYPSIPVCLYTNTSQSQGVPTSSASKTLSQMSNQNKYRRYSHASLMDAVAAVVNRKMTSNEASRFFKVPRSTVRFQATKLSKKKTTEHRTDKERHSILQTGGNETDSRGQEMHKTKKITAVAD